MRFRVTVVRGARPFWRQGSGAVPRLCSLPAARAASGLRKWKFQSFSDGSADVERSMTSSANHTRICSVSAKHCNQLADYSVGLSTWCRAQSDCKVTYSILTSHQYLIKSTSHPLCSSVDLRMPQAVVMALSNHVTFKRRTSPQAQCTQICDASLQLNTSLLPEKSAGLWISIFLDWALEHALTGSSVHPASCNSVKGNVSGTIYLRICEVKPQQVAYVL